MRQSLASLCSWACQFESYPEDRFAYDMAHMSRLMTKPTKWHVCPVKTRISLGMHPVWSDAQADLSLRWAHNHFVGFVMRRLMVLSWGGSHNYLKVLRLQWGLLLVNALYLQPIWTVIQMMHFLTVKNLLVEYHKICACFISTVNNFMTVAFLSPFASLWPFFVFSLHHYDPFLCFHWPWQIF